MKPTIVLRFLILLLPACLTGQPLELPPNWEERVTQLLLADIPAGAPGGAVGIVLGDSIIYERYAGLADLDTGRAIGPDTRFNIASNAKQFTALCVLRLAAAGKLALEDDVRTYLPELLPDAPPVTVGQLLTHTAGLRDVYNLWSLRGITWWEASLTNDDAYQLLLRQQGLNFPPGSDYSYSNSNYLLLTQLVEQVSGRAFADYAGVLFHDLGMLETQFVADHTVEIPNLARPYFNFDTWQTYELLGDLHGDGALFTSLPDQLRFEQLLRNPAELSPELRAIISLSQTRPGSYPGNYGFGVEHLVYRGLEQRMHNGSTGAWKATFLRFPEWDLSVVVANNSGKFFASDLARDVADVLLEGQLTGPRYATRPGNQTESADTDITGVYGTTQGFALRIDRAGGDTLTLHRFNRPDIRIAPVRPGVYREVTDTTFIQHFDLAADGQLRITLYHPSHGPYSLTRTAGMDTAPAAEETDFTGRYCNGETGVTLAVVPGSQPGLVLQGDTLQTEAFSERVYVTQRYTFLLEEEKGQPIVYLFDDRLRWVRFDSQTAD